MFSVSVLYLALPHMIFCFGWMKWHWAVLCFLSGTVSVVFSISSFNREAESEKEDLVFPCFYLVWVVVLATVFSVITGAGIGYFHQAGDWHKHNAVFLGLIERQWPVYYSTEAGAAPLVYYVAYYLPAAAVGKAFGWLAANWALFIWNTLGLVLAAMWFVVLAEKRGLWIPIIFFIFSGLDYFGASANIIDRVNPESFPQWSDISGWIVFLKRVCIDYVLLEVFFNQQVTEFWSGGFQYSCNMAHLFWSPNQALAGWILAGMVFRLFGRPSLKNNVLILLSFSLLWGPFITIGLLPFLAADFFAGSAKKSANENGSEGFLTRIREYLTAGNASAAVVFLFAGLFFLAKFSGSPLGPVQDRHGFIFSGGAGQVFDRIGLLVSFCVLEFGVFAVLIFAGGSARRSGRGLLAVVSVAVLLILPLYRYGYYNDLMVRASIPALFALSVFVARAVYDERAAKTVRLLLVLFLLIGSISAMVEIKRNTAVMCERPDLAFYIPVKGSVDDLPAVHRFRKKVQPNFFGQYIGDPSSPFFRIIAREKADATGSHEYDAL